MSFVAVGIVAGVGALASAGVAAHGANKAKKAAEAKERASRAEMERLKKAYSELDTSNPYKDMENMMEDLTINQKQAQFQKQQFEQTQANTLSQLRQSAGGSAVTDGVSGDINGVVFYTIPQSLAAGTTYVYQCTAHAAMVGNLTVV